MPAKEDLRLRCEKLLYPDGGSIPPNDSTAEHAQIPVMRRDAARTQDTVPVHLRHRRPEWSVG